MFPVVRAPALARSLLAASAVLLAFSLVDAGARAQPANASQEAADALKTAFDALPEADRRAIQDALVWTGDYKGAVDGVLGRGGREALAAYARRAKLAPEAVLGEAARKRLLAEGQKLRAASNFRAAADARSGASISLPASVFTRRADAPAGARWTNAAGSATLETFREESGDLPALYERLRAAAPGRKITYSVLRPDFLVVAGEDARGLFYTRAARGEVAGKSVVRGYALVYARALQPSFETFAIAISNGFEPFPAARPAGAAVAAAQGLVIEATAVAIGPDRALTSLTRACPGLRVAGRPGKVLRADEASGLALIEAPGLRAALVRPAVRAPAADTDVFALFTAPAGAGAAASLAPGRVMAPAGAGAPWRVSAAVQDGVGGAAVFDRTGAFVGLLAQPSAAPRRIAGVIPQAAWRLIPSADALAFLSASGVRFEAGESASSEKSAGEIAAANAAALLAVSCER